MESSKIRSVKDGRMSRLTIYQDHKSPLKPSDGRMSRLATYGDTTKRIIENVIELVIADDTFVSYLHLGSPGP
jgi:hypothetical protein